LTKCCPKFLEKERMLSGVHAAPGRQVSTWAHAVKAEESARVGGSLAILHGGSLSIFHPPSELIGLCHRPLHIHGHPRNHSREGEN
jgi:hypothetical protein